MRVCRCRVTIFIVYNAYPAKGKQKTWEKRVVCISWVMGCYKTMKQNVDGRCGRVPTCIAQQHLRLPNCIKSWAVKAETCCGAQAS